MSSVQAPETILDPGLCLTLRPMRYPIFYEMFRDGIKNTWTVEEVDFQTDLADLKQRLSLAEVHLIQRLVAFFATGDSIVSNNLVLNLYRHINSPEARLYLSRQLTKKPFTSSSTSLCWITMCLTRKSGLPPLRRSKISPRSQRRLAFA
jgi:ribonucleoside-diphosphate reductase beta chain